MNDKTGRSSKLRLLLLFLMPGIIILTVVFEIQTNIEKNRANTDASVIINFMKEECVRYEKIYAQDDMEDQFSIEDILTGYKVERAGIIVLTDGERIISSNDLTMRGKTVAENPYIQAFNSYQESKKLVRISKDGKVYYGKYAKCGQYSIYRTWNGDGICCRVLSCSLVCADLCSPETGEAADCKSGVSA